MQSKSVIGDSVFSRFWKLLAIPRQVKREVVDKEKKINPQKELIKAIKQEGSPDYELIKTLAIIDKNLCGDPFPLGKGYANYGYLLYSARKFVEDFREGNTNAKLTYFLNDGELKLVLGRTPNGNLSIALIPEEKLSKEIKEKIEELGLKIGGATLTTPILEISREIISDTNNDIVQAIQSKNTRKFLSFLGHVDNLITQNPFGGYKETQHEDLINRIEYFIERAQDINPYAVFSFNLGDNKSKLLITIDVQRGNGQAKHVLSFDIETHDTKIKEKFNEFKAIDGLLKEQVI